CPAGQRDRRLGDCDQRQLGGIERDNIEWQIEMTNDGGEPARQPPAPRQPPSNRGRKVGLCARFSAREDGLWIDGGNGQPAQRREQANRPCPGKVDLAAAVRKESCDRSRSLADV